jgi:hypothetical protein
VWRGLLGVAGVAAVLTRLPTVSRRTVPARRHRRPALLLVVTLFVTYLAHAATAGADYQATVLADHPVGYWPLSDPAGSPNAQDLTGTSNGGLNPGVTVAGVPGPVPGTTAFSFNGGNCSGVELDADAANLRLQSFSVEAWVQSPSASDGIIFRWRTFGYGLYPTDFGLYPNGNNAGASSATNPLSDGRWHYVVGTYDASSGITFYIDGEQIGYNPTTGPPTYGAGQVAIGRDADACDGVVPSFEGNIGQVAVYAYALSASQVAAHYSAVAAPAGTCPPTSVTATLPNLAAQGCRAGTDLQSLSQGVEGLLNVAGRLPHVSQIGPLWVAPEGGTITAQSGSDAEAWANLIKDAAADLGKIVGDTAAEHAASALGGCGAGIAAALTGAASSASDAAIAAGKAAQALAGATNGGSSTGSDTSTVAGYAELSGIDDAAALHSLASALDKATNECAAENAPTVVIVQLKVIIVVLIHTDQQLHTQEQQQIGLVPLGGYDLIPGTPSDNFTTGATAIIDSAGPEWSGSVLSGSLNPVGLSSSTVIHEPTLGTLATLNQGTITNVGQGSLVTLSGTGFQFNWPVAFSLGSTPQRLTVQKTNATGVVAATVQIPSDVQPGHHELYAVGTGLDGSLRVLGTGITVTAPTSPLLTGVHESDRRWREGRALAKAGRRHRTRGQAVGTTFSFTLNEPARVTLTFTQPGEGRNVNGKCVAQSHKNRRARTCKRLITRGTLILAGHTGAETLAFQGRLSKTRHLKPGGYTVQITAANTVGRSRPVSLTFTIVR